MPFEFSPSGSPKCATSGTGNETVITRSVVGADDVDHPSQACPDDNTPSLCKNRSTISLEDLYVLLQENKKIALSALETAERNRISQLEIPHELIELAALLKQTGLPHETSLNRFLDAMFVGHDVRTMIKWPIQGWEEFRVAIAVALSTFGNHFQYSPLPSVPAPPGSSCIKRKVVDLPASYGDFVVPSFPIDMTISDVANSSMNWIAKKVPFASLVRDWVRMEDHPPVRVTGKELRSISNMSSDINNDVAEGVIRVLNADVASKVKHDTSFAPRCYVTIAFVNNALSNKDGDIAGMDMLSMDVLGYDIRFCHQFVAVVPLKNIWACFSWDFKKRHFTLVDPTDISMTSKEIQAKHKANFSLLNKKLIDVLRQIHGDLGYGAGPWTMLVHSGIGHNCIKNASGVYALTCARVVDCASGALAADTFDVIQTTQVLLYKMLIQKGDLGRYVLPPSAPAKDMLHPTCPKSDW